MRVKCEGSEIPAVAIAMLASCMSDSRKLVSGYGSYFPKRCRSQPSRSSFRAICLSSDSKPRKRIKDPDALERFRLEHAYEPCDECGLRPGSEVHHDTFRSQSGGDVPSNLRWLCTVCHSGRHGIRAFTYDSG